LVMLVLFLAAANTLSVKAIHHSVCHVCAQY
jgi:hypothetical protein